MKNFKTFLSTLVLNCKDVYGALILDSTGIILSKYFNEKLPKSQEVLEAIAIEFVSSVNNIRDLSLSTNLGLLKSVALDLGQYQLLFKFLVKDKFLTIFAGKDAILGQINYYSEIESRYLIETLDV